MPEHSGEFSPPWIVSQEFWKATLQSDVSGIATDVKLFRESGCRIVHWYRIYRDPMPHVSLRDGVIRKLLAFVHRTMAIAQLTHLQLTSGLVHPDTFLIVPLTRKLVGQNKVYFAENVEVIGPSPPLSPPNEEPNSPGETPDSPDDTSQHVRH